MNCLFCTEYQGKTSNVFWEGYQFFARIDDYPAAPGHFLIVSKRHVERLEDLSRREFDSLHQAIPAAVKAASTFDLKSHYEGLLGNNERMDVYLRKALESPHLGEPIMDYNAGWNNGPLAGQTIRHTHMHVIPRYEMEQGYHHSIRNVIHGVDDFATAHE